MWINSSSSPPGLTFLALLCLLHLPVSHFLPHQGFCLPTCTQGLGKDLGGNCSRSPHLYGWKVPRHRHFATVPRQRLESGMPRRLAQSWTEVTRCPKGIPVWIIRPNPVPDPEPSRLNDRKQGGGGAGKKGRAGMLPSQAPLLEQTVPECYGLVIHVKMPMPSQSLPQFPLVLTTQASAPVPFLVLF